MGDTNPVSALACVADRPKLCGALAIGIAGTVGVRIWLRSQHHSKVPRGLRSNAFLSKDEMPKHSADGKNGSEIHRDGYSLKKVPKDLDVIIVGSGIGGLACAGLLARVGLRCLVLEQHYIAGGCTHAFEEGGFEFDTGVHYIGNVKKRQKYFDLITDEPLKWDQMGSKDNGFLYDEVVVGGGRRADGTTTGEVEHRYDFRAGQEAFIEEIVSKFPSERPAVEEYVRLIRTISKKDVFFDLKIAKPLWLANILRWFLVPDKFKEMNLKTARQVIATLTDNLDLQAVLLSQFGDYGSSPDVESFFMHASVANHYIDGGFYPNGGATAIAKGIIPVIERAGGRVLVRKGVKRILVEDSAVQGVEMDNGDQIFAPKVVTACGVFTTMKLLPEESIPRPVKEIFNSKIGKSVSFFYLFVGIDGDHDELKLRSSNIWHWPQRDYGKMISDWYADPDNAPIPMFIGFPCAKDSTWKTRFPGKSNAVIMTMQKYEWWDQWDDKRQGHRGADYEEKKKKLGDRILEEGLYHYYPQTREKVSFTMTGSALTFNHFIGSHEGEVYGLDSTPLRFQAGPHQEWLRPRMPGIKGGFQTGVDVTTLGVTGGLMAGILTAHDILDYGTLPDLLSGRNLIEDLWHLEAKEGKRASA